MTAFADDGVVRLLTGKIQLCKAASQEATAGTKISQRREYSVSKGAAAAAEGVGTEEVLAKPLPSVAEDTHRSSICTVINNVDESEVDGEGPKSSSAKLLELQKNSHQALPCCCSYGRDAGANRAQRRSPFLLSRAAIPMFAIDSTTKQRAGSKQVEHGRGDHKGVEEDVDGCARAAEREDGWGGEGKDVGGLEYQKMPEIVRTGSTRGVDERGHVFADAPARANEDKDRNIYRDDDEVATHAFNESSSGDVSSPCNEPSILGGDPAIPPPLREEHSPLSSTGGGLYRHLVSGNDSPATIAVMSTSTATEGTPDVSTPISSPTSHPYPLGEVRNENLTQGDTFTIAARRDAALSSFAGVLVERQSAAAEEKADLKVAAFVAAPGLPIPSFEQKLECGAALDQGYEEASNPLVAHEDHSEPGFDGGHDRPEDEDAGISTTASLCNEKFIGADGSDFSTDIDGFSVKKQATEMNPGQTEGIFVGKKGGLVAPTALRAATVSAVARESGWEQERPKTVAEIGRQSGKPFAVLAEGTGPHYSSLLALGRLELSPNTFTTEDEDTEDYEFTFDDEELVTGRKIVRFADESLWSVHEVRASFDQHELGELFYTTNELDRMQEEAELEEALERSKSRDLQEEDNSDDGVQKRAHGVGAKLEGLQNVIFESLTFDDIEDSDCNF